MWLCSLDDTGGIKKRKLSKKEIVIDKTDSIGRVYINIDEPLKGKVLLRKYVKYIPFYHENKYEKDVGMGVKNINIAFQKHIPLLKGNYQLVLRKSSSNIVSFYDFVQIGEGDLNINRTNSVVQGVSYYADSGSGTTLISASPYAASVFNISVSNVPPLAPAEDKEPLGVKIFMRNEWRNM